VKAKFTRALEPLRVSRIGLAGHGTDLNQEMKVFECRPASARDAVSALELEQREIRKRDNLEAKVLSRLRLRSAADTMQPMTLRSDI